MKKTRADKELHFVFSHNLYADSDIKTSTTLYDFSTGKKFLQKLPFFIEIQLRKKAV
jgi:hypothetical protein